MTMAPELSGNNIIKLHIKNILAKIHFDSGSSVTTIARFARTSKAICSICTNGIDDTVMRSCVPVMRQYPLAIV